MSDFLPKQPSDAELKIIKEMFEASVNGEAYDPERWGAYYKPAGLRSDNTPSSTTQSAPVQQAAPAARPAPVAEVEEEEPVATAPVAEAKPSSQRAEDILAMIRNRQK